MRLHAGILAAQGGSLVIPIIYHHKVEQFAAKIQVLKFAHHLGDGGNWKKSKISAKDLLSSYLEATKNLDSCLNQIESSIENLKHNEKQNGFVLKELAIK
jgi:polysaccharide pyruvyl transferase WcaK-like protein